MTMPSSAASGLDHIAAIRQTIPPTVRLVAVTKTVSPEVMRQAYGLGLRDFGESRLPEAIAKQAVLADLPDITWHLIGHLQTNKARKALQHFQWIHSVDSLKLAQKLAGLVAEGAPAPQCCLQVKLVPDPAKYGFSIEDLWQGLSDLDQLAYLNVVGLMTIPPQNSSLEESKLIFEQARSLADRINAQGFDRIQIRELSMGMSGDYPAAIAAGATMVRLGTTLFGDRTP